MSDFIQLNVCGAFFEIGRNLILRHPNDFLTKLISPENAALAQKDQQGRYRIQRNPALFPFILSVYLTDQIVFPKLVSKDDFLDELDFFGIDIPPMARMPSPKEIIDYGLISDSHELIKAEKHYARHPVDFIVEANSLVENIEAALKSGKRFAYGHMTSSLIDHYNRCFNFKSVEPVKIKTSYPGIPIEHRPTCIITFEGYDRQCTGGIEATTDSRGGVKVTF